ncbi:MAG TPA: PfkB family carbohydrate kinase [Patescibacteria group bacterium]|nr:PfkB family carbohydrate kinase [Patescibacteria group bacterium]
MQKSGYDTKYLSAEEFALQRAKWRQAGQKVSLCHGVFDLLHPGHIAHLEEAKSIADILVVSITSAPHVNRGPGRPYFPDELRLKSLAALSCVDYVLLAEYPTATEMISLVQPDFYVKGKEYEKSADDVTGNIDAEVEQVREFGGDVYFTDGVVFSSTKLLNNGFPVFPPGVKEFAKSFAVQHSFAQVREIVESMANLSVLVIGDIIIDEYVFCGVQGLMSKDRAFSTRYSYEECYMGGSLAIAKHLSNFSNRVSVCSIIGEDNQLHSRLLNDLARNILLDLHIDKNFKTAVKRRYIERHGIRSEYEKLFSVNYLFSEEEAKQYDRTAFNERLKKIVKDYDLIVVADYGHGLLNEESIDIIQNNAKYLALNCQTNSSNFGTNLITKYRRANVFTLDDRELRLAYADRTSTSEELLVKLMQHFQGNFGWGTMGSFGSVSVDSELKTEKFPALTLTVQDLIGAGDAFFALVALGAKVGAPVAVSSFLGNIAGAMAANIVGNSRSVGKGELLKFASTILNF